MIGSILSGIKLVYFQFGLSSYYDIYFITDWIDPMKNEAISSETWSKSARRQDCPFAFSDTILHGKVAYKLQTDLQSEKFLAEK